MVKKSTRLLAREPFISYPEPIPTMLFTVFPPTDVLTVFLNYLLGILMRMGLGMRFDFKGIGWVHGFGLGISVGEAYRGIGRHFGYTYSHEYELL